MRRTRSSRGTGGRSRRPHGIKTHLLNPQYKTGERGNVEAITGTCTEPGCKNTRTIKPQDAFQVRRCVECQKRALYRRIAAKRKERVGGTSGGREH